MTKRAAACSIQQLLDRVSRLPHVTGATVARTMPLDVGGSSDMTVTVDGYTPRDGEEPMAYYNQVGPAYFETLGIPLVKGRGITSRDAAGQPAVAVINETMARRYWAGRDPIGGTIRFGRGPVTIVGVARDGKYSRLSEEPRNYLYLPALQNYRPDLLLHVRTDTDPLAGASGGSRRGARPGSRICRCSTCARSTSTCASARFSRGWRRRCSACSASSGLLLASVGLYGVIAFNAAQRTREIGLRMALGADRAQVVWLVLRSGLTLAAAGILAGLGLAFGAGRLVAGQLTGITGADPVSFLGTTAVLTLVAVLACVLPARRAASLEPLVALRRD